MKHVLSVLAVLGILLSAGTADLRADAAAVPLDGAASGPVCTVPYCTDPAHCHTYAAARHCRNRLTGYGRHHWYAADTVQAPAQEPLFWNCMGCTDPACTDPTHFHHCAAGCTVAEHYHDCPAGCTAHNHGGWQQGHGSGHHGGGHHGWS